MSKNIEFYFDFGSPTAYLANGQLPAIAAQHGAELVYKPILLGGVFQATNNHSPVTIPAKGAYMFRDLQRYAQRYDMPFRLNPHFPINTLMLMRMATGVLQRQPDQFVNLVKALFDAIWVDELNLGEPEVVASVLRENDLDADALFDLAQDDEVKQQLKQATQKAVERGVFGAPTMFVGKEMFWGQDRLDFVSEALADDSSNTSASQPVI